MFIPSKTVKVASVFSANAIHCGGAENVKNALLVIYANTHNMVMIDFNDLAFLLAFF
jgi:hypothetical protein